jgi:AAA family ATP:ADP antiporter
MVVQCYWALVNSSVDVTFAKKNFGYIVAGASLSLPFLPSLPSSLLFLTAPPGAQIGSILGPTLATQAEVVGIASLYLVGSLVMFLMVGAMFIYIRQFGAHEEAPSSSSSAKEAAGTSGKAGKAEEGVMEGFNLFYEHDYVKGIFAVSSLYMVQVTVIDYMMKLLAKQRYAALYPDDPQAALRAFASFMGYFGQTTNSISFLFSLFGTGECEATSPFTPSHVPSSSLLLLFSLCQAL